ncbi:MAG: Tex-like N-terminal domain-containing protein, partial [Flavobacteriales bacterium]
MSIAQLIKLPNVAQHQVSAVLQMVEEGATVPFMARYRKERTKGLDELQILAVVNAKLKLDEVIKRKQSILKSIGEQDQLSDELQASIEKCWNLSDLEDLYLPFKSKRATKASLARDLGLEPLAGAIMKQELNDPEAYAFRFVKGKVKNVEDALEGAQFIMAEWINERSYARKRLRELFFKSAYLTIKVKDQDKDPDQKYKDYYSYSSPIVKTPGYRLLAALRGEKLGAL